MSDLRFIDLHTHTTASDGSDAPAELVALAARAKLAAIAITDHDTVDGLDDASEAGRKLGMEVIRGCELAVSSEYGEIHILGLWIPEHAAPLTAKLQELRGYRSERNVRIVDRLCEIGLALSYDEVVALSGGISVGRPHIARAMVNRGYVPSVADAFTRYLGPDGEAFVPKTILSPQEGVALLANLGATVSLAHPMLMRCPQEWLEDLVADLGAVGLDAIEAYHSEHSQLHERYCVELAARHGMVLTGGSDYHGLAKPAISIGRGRGGLRVTTHVLEQLKRLRGRKGLPC